MERLRTKRPESRRNLTAVAFAMALAQAWFTPSSASADVLLPPSDGMRDIKKAWNDRLAVALRARNKEPAFVYSQRPVEALDPCSVQVSARPKEDADAARAAFIKRNGKGWRVGTDEFNAAINSARTGPDSYPALARESGDKLVTEDQAIALAATFAATNYDLFGLDRDDLLAVTDVWIQTGPAGPRDEPKVVYELRVRGSRPEPAFRDIESMNRTWQLTIEVAHTGYVWSARGRLDALGKFSICDKPKLDAKAAAKQVVGLPLSYFSAHGKVTEPSAKDSEIGEVTPTLYRTFLRSPDRAVVRRAYNVVVKRSPFNFLVIINATSGDVIWSGPKDVIID